MIYGKCQEDNLPSPLETEEIDLYDTIHNGKAVQIIHFRISKALAQKNFCTVYKFIEIKLKTTT